MFTVLNLLTSLKVRKSERVRTYRMLLLLALLCKFITVTLKNKSGALATVPGLCPTVPSRRCRSWQRYSTVNGIEAFYNDSTDGDTTTTN